MNAEPSLFAYVNILGGYTWIAGDGAECSSPFIKAMQNFIRDISDRKEPSRLTLVNDKRTYHIVGAYDPDGADEAGRQGIVTLFGLADEGNLGQGDVEKLAAYAEGELVPLRARLTAAKIPREMAILAVRGHINSSALVQKARATEKAIKRPPAEQRYLIVDTTNRWERLTLLALLAGVFINSLLLTLAVIAALLMRSPS